MKIINRKEFLLINKPTLFQKVYKYCFDNELLIKLETIGEDFFEISLSGNQDINLIKRIFDTQECFEHDYEIIQRDGCYEDEEECFFAIYELKDIENLIKKLIDIKGDTD